METPKIQSKEQLERYLSENKRTELSKILVFWEKYKEEWERMKTEFWKDFHVETSSSVQALPISSKWNDKIKYEFRNLLLQYEESKQNFISWLSQKEQKIVNALNWIAKEKFYKEYLFDRILYGWNPEKQYPKTQGTIRDTDKIEEEIKEYKWKLKPWIHIECKCIGDKGIIFLAKEWKDKLQPWMSIDLSTNGIREEWLESIVRERKNCLQPWMTIKLESNYALEKLITILTEWWKNSLKPWMIIGLGRNFMWDKCAIAISKMELQEWVVLDLNGNSIWDDWVTAISKMKLQEWVNLDLRRNSIWDDWVQAIMDNLQLKNGVIINLYWNKRISQSKKEELKTWVKSKQEEWINCEIKI